MITLNQLDESNTADTEPALELPEEPKPNLHVLMIEDMPEDFELVIHELKKCGLRITSTRVETSQELALELQIGPVPDLVLSDHACGTFDSFGVLAQVRATLVDVPFILVTGAPSDKLMVKALGCGVDDWVSKHRLEELLPAVLRAIRLAEERRRWRTAEKERDWLQAELALVRGQQALRLIVPICCVCKKIRTEKNEWIPLEGYFEHRHAMQFTHSYCPECAKNVV